MDKDLKLKLPNYYTQRQWDRTVGFGKIPDEYSIEYLKKKDIDKNDEESDK
jgi:hypothetical protein